MDVDDYFWGSDRTLYQNRQDWLNAILYGRNKPKPPNWWLVAKGKEGREMSASYAIWYKNYPPARQFVIWDQAPLEDFIQLSYA